MTIAIIAAPYLPVPPVKYGGTERVLFNLIKGLKELGHHVILFGTGDSKVDCELIPITEKSIPWVKDPEADRELDRTVRAEAIKNTYKLIKENLSRIDIIHWNNPDIGEFREFPHLVTIHGPMLFSLDPKSSFHQYPTDLYYNTISFNQGLSTKHLNVLGTIYHGLDPADFPLVKEPDDYFCFLGRYNEDKSPDQAMHLAVELGKELYIAAKLDHTGIQYLEEKCKPLMDDYPELIHDLGEQDDKGKIEMISHALVNLHPAAGFREPFGLSILESTYCGTPTLAVRKGSLAELIEDGKTGILVEDYVEGMNRISECYTMNREYISERARRLFNYKTMATLYVMAYETIINIYKMNIHNNPEQLQGVLLDSRIRIEEKWKEMTSFITPS